MKNIIYLFIIAPLFMFSQIGINTTTPQETLDVEGTLRVSNTTSCMPDKLSGTNNNGVLTNVMVGDNLDLTGNVLSANVTGGSAFYLVATIPVPDGPPGEELHNFDLDLSGANANRVVFRLVGRTANYKITGIAGGTDGRHIVLFNVSTSNLTLVAESIDSVPQNRMITLANNVATSGQGTAELVYDGTLQRWILIGFRD